VFFLFFFFLGGGWGRGGGGGGFGLGFFWGLGVGGAVRVAFSVFLLFFPSLFFLFIAPLHLFLASYYTGGGVVGARCVAGFVSWAWLVVHFCGGWGGFGGGGSAFECGGGVLWGVGLGGRCLLWAWRLPGGACL